MELQRAVILSHGSITMNNLIHFLLIYRLLDLNYLTFTPPIPHFTNHFSNLFLSLQLSFSSLNYSFISLSHCLPFPSLNSSQLHVLVSLSSLPFPSLFFLYIRSVCHHVFDVFFSLPLRRSSLVLGLLPALCWCFYHWGWNRLGSQWWVIRLGCTNTDVVAHHSFNLFVSYYLAVRLHMYNTLFDHLIHTVSLYSIISPSDWYY